MNSVKNDYSIEIDKVNKQEWEHILNKFDDATIYSTWSYSIIHWGENNLNHVVLMHKNYIVAAAQVNIISIPLMKKKIAYIPHGPMWRLSGKNDNLDVLRQMIRALRREYVMKQGFILRLFPNIIDDGTNKIRSIFDCEGFVWKSYISPYRTFIIDLNPSLEDLRKGLRKSWRKTLNRAQKNDLEIIEGTSEDLIDIFLTIHKQMLSRKKFVENANYNEFKKIQNELSPAQKLIIAVCKFQGKPIAALGWSAIGNTGLGILAASNKKAIELNASYLLRWHQIEWLKEHGYRWFDLGGINPVRNPGVYVFKSGLVGKNGRDVQFIGQYDTFSNYYSSLFIRSIDLARLYRRNFKFVLNKLIYK